MLGGYDLATRRFVSLEGVTGTPGMPLARRPFSVSGVANALLATDNPQRHRVIFRQLFSSAITLYVYFGSDASAAFAFVLPSGSTVLIDPAFPWTGPVYVESAGGNLTIGGIELSVQ